MNFKALFSVQSLFDINRVTLGRADLAFMFIGLLLVLLAVILKLAAAYAPTPVDKKYRGNFFSLFAWIGILELLWFGARAQFVRFFGTRFMALVILLIGAAWFVPLVVKTFRFYGKEKAQWEKDQVKQKYLPKQA